MYRNLETKQEMYTHVVGKMEELVVLAGTVPVHYRVSYYNIHISMYLPKDFPTSPPICYVKPTPTMIIKQSKNVDGSGRVYLPYLSSWGQAVHSADSFDLLGVIQVMICIFGESPPLYQKPKESYTSSQPNDSCPYPRQPPTSGHPAVVTVAGFPPATSYPPYTPYPPGSSASTTGYPPAVAPGNFGYPGYPPVTSSFPTPVSSSSNSNFNTVTPDHIKASLISAIEEEVRNKTSESISQKQAEIEVLQNTAFELEKGRDKLNDLLSRMETDLVLINESKSQLEDKDRQFTEIINKLQDCSEKPPNIEEAFGPLEPLYKQLLNAYAEENAITDAMHYLLEALQKGAIDLDKFLKCTRDLSRKQFMLRSLMQKCRERAGLPY